MRFRRTTIDAKESESRDIDLGKKKTSEYNFAFYCFVRSVVLEQFPIEAIGKRSPSANSKTKILLDQ